MLVLRGLMYRARLLRPDHAMLPKVGVMMASQELVAVLALILVLVVALALGNRTVGGVSVLVFQTMPDGVSKKSVGIGVCWMLSWVSKRSACGSAGVKKGDGNG